MIRAEDLKEIPLFCSEQAWNGDIRRWAGGFFSKLRLEGSFRLSYNGSVFAREGLGYLLTFRHLIDTSGGSGLVFDSSVSEDELDRNWQRLILTHLAERRHPGVLTGSPITDMKITLAAGRAHLKHTEGGDFRQATYRAVRQGLMRAKSILLEPWYAFRIEVPPEQIGRAISDVRAMNGVFESPEDAGEFVFRVNNERIYIRGTNWKPLDAPIEVREQTLTNPPRTGFTSVEWGGAEVLS